MISAPLHFELPGRFMVTHPVVHNEFSDPNLYRFHGHAHPTLFKTYRNAKKQAQSSWHDGQRFRNGLVLQLTPGALAVIADDPGVEQIADRLTVLEFAERQMLIWNDIAERLKNGESTFEIGEGGRFL